MDATRIKEGLRKSFTDIKYTFHHIGDCVCIFLSEEEYTPCYCGRCCWGTYWLLYWGYYGGLGWNGYWGALIYSCYYCWGGLGGVGGACRKGCAAIGGP